MLKQSIKVPMTLAGLLCLTVGIASAQPAPDAPPPQQSDGMQPPPRDDAGGQPNHPRPRNQQGRPGGPMGQMGGPGGGPMGPMGGQMGGPGGPHGMMPPGGMPGMGDMQMQMQDATYLGIEVSPIDPAMKAQLKLTKTDSGLLINFVAADSPAKAAGLQQYDVLAKLDDQILFNPPQLQSLVRIHKAGDEVKLTYIREGQPQTTTAKLETKQQPVQQMFGGPGMPFGAMPAEMQERMRQMADSNMATNRVTYQTGDVSLTIRPENGKPILAAKDKAGKELFNGSIETPEQRATLPADVRQALDQVAEHYLVTSLVRTGRGPGAGGFGPGRGMGGGFGGQGPDRQPER